jgi:VanZ family protein
LLATAYGVSDEYHQSFVPGRDASVRDVGSDFAGAALGALGCRLAGARRVVARG